MSTSRASVAAAMKRAGNPGMRALIKRLRSGPGGCASKVAIPGPQTSVRAAKLLDVERDTPTDSGLTMRYLAGSIHRRPPSRLRSTADVGKSEFTLLATSDAPGLYPNG